MTRFYSKLAFTAVLASVIAGQAQAQPGYPNWEAQKQTHLVWHFPYKAAPYATWVPNDAATQKSTPAPKVAHVKKAKKADVAGHSSSTPKLPS